MHATLLAATRRSDELRRFHEFLQKTIVSMTEFCRRDIGT